jgi:predicted N-acyltransferase
MLGRGKGCSVANSATGTTTVAYSYRIFNSIEHVDATEWQRVRSACDGSIVMDPRFIAAVEASMKQVCKFWYIVIYDEDGAPVACTSASAITADLVDVADPGLAQIIRHVPLLFSWLRHLKIIICGLPIGGHHTLGVAKRAASPQILPVLDTVLCDLATEANADAIVYKEFEKGDLEWTAPLLALGYRRIPTPPTHYFRPLFDDFAQYCAALKKHYRKQINRSRRKLNHPGLDLIVVTDPKEIVRAYTSEVHSLYHQMADRAAIRLEVLPIEFLHQAALRLDGQIELIVIRKDARIVAFACCLHAQSTYYTMYGGLDYRLNDEFDLYFNLVYALLDRGLQKRVSIIVFGIGADAVKSRIGCYSERLYVFAKGRGPLMSLIIRAAGNFLIAQKPATTRFNIFKNKSPQDSRESGQSTT